jgi:acetyl esterase
MSETTQLDSQTATVLADLDGPGVPQVADMAPPAARKWIDDFVRKWDLEPKPEVGGIEDFDVPGPTSEPNVRIPVRLYRPAAAAGPLPIMVFFHAGGYVFGSIETHESFCRLMTRETECLVLSVGYRLAPEHKFPTAHEDVYAATLWAAEHAGEIGADPNRLAVGGDSSGGTLATGASQLARERGGPKICHQMLWYPGTGGSPDSPSMRELSEGYFLTGALMKWSMGHYLNDQSEMENPLIQPFRQEDLSGLPPTYLMTAGFDPRRDDNKDYADRLTASGVPVTFRCIDNTIHGFMFMLGGIDLAVDAAKESAAYLKNAFAQA